MITCKDVCDNATDFLEGPTTFLERANLRLHLLMCKHCRRFIRQFRTTVAVTRHLGDKEPPSDEEIDNLLQKLGEHRQI